MHSMNQAATHWSIFNVHEHTRQENQRDKNPSNGRTPDRRLPRTPGRPGRTEAAKTQRRNSLSVSRSAFEDITREIAASLSLAGEISLETAASGDIASASATNIRPKMSQLGRARTRRLGSPWLNQSATGARRWAIASACVPEALALRDRALSSCT